MEEQLEAFRAEISRIEPNDAIAYHSWIRRLSNFTSEAFAETAFLQEITNEILDVENLSKNARVREDWARLRPMALAVLDHIDLYIKNIKQSYLRDVFNQALKETTNPTFERINEELTNARNELARLRTEADRFSETIQQRETIINRRDFRSQAQDNLKIAGLLMFLILVFTSWLTGRLITLANFENEILSIAANVHDGTLKWERTFVVSGFLDRIFYIEVAKKLATRVLSYSLLIFIISFLVKNFNAQMHNYVANSNKANAFDSVTSLVGTSKTKAGHDTSLSQLIQSVFSSQRSGYQGADNEASSPNNIFTQVVDAVKPK